MEVRKERKREGRKERRRWERRVTEEPKTNE